ncbi:phenylalanine--tRNA ligase beta subunit-related protein [Arthrobacter sp. H20]|uniref:B3/B4 domain-containing protein n=1 Tax=Arthrobacter sp. H20 TaxID=1267981 RepID=UPI00047EAFA1|nr:phenylalanine--tRNA ligase beta subunit-related protein [Arthrobacter sp. H20]
MSDLTGLQKLVDSGHVDPEVFLLRPDFAVDLLNATAVDQLPHVAAWREAYRSFGAKPQRTRNGLEALIRRAATGLPRINRLTDIYNAVSVFHQIPLGGEEIASYVGAPRLIRATGNEPFDTATGGAGTVEYPEPGEVVRSDDVGVTCRRWNWRQRRRTQNRDDTSTALFILDALEPMSDDDLQCAADVLSAHLKQLGPNVRIARRLISSERSAS